MARHLTMSSLPARDPEIGRWLWALEEVRRTTLKALVDCNASKLVWRGPDEQENSIGSLLYHIAGVEMGWLFLDLLQEPWPERVRQLLPWPLIDEHGRLTEISGVSLEQHLEALRETRTITLSRLAEFDLEKWRRLHVPIDGSDYEVTPEWAVFHLVEHEAGHAFQIKSLAARWRRLRR